LLVATGAAGLTGVVDFFGTTAAGATLAGIFSGWLGLVSAHGLVSSVMSFP